MVLLESWPLGSKCGDDCKSRDALFLHKVVLILFALKESDAAKITIESGYMRFFKPIDKTQIFK